MHRLRLGLRAGLVATLAACAVESGAAADEALATADAAAREKLAFIIGTWTIEGMEDTFTETCEWFHNRSHVVCNSEERSADGVSKGVSVFSWSPRLGRHLYYHYGSSGAAHPMDVFIVDRTLRATHERRVGNDLIREQVLITPRPDGGFDFLEETSTNGSPWTESVRLRYVRRRP
jgi:hypothetical protein